MRKYYFIIVTIIYSILLSCNNEREQIVSENTNTESETALELIKEFSAKVNNGSRSFFDSDLKVTKIEKNTIAYQAKTNALARSGVAEVENVDLFTFSIEKNGKEGFAIASSDKRINRVLAYVENGSISDTIFNKGMAMMLGNIPYVCAEDLERYYQDTASILSRASDEIYIPSFVVTQWGQGAPYNNSCPEMNCSRYSNGRAPAGCVGIALAQAVACYPIEHVQYLFGVSLINKRPRIYEWDTELVPVVAYYVWEMARGCWSDFSCEGTSSDIEKAKNFLIYTGYIEGYDFYWRRANNVNKQELFWAMNSRVPVISFGNSDSGEGHAWLFDGMTGRVVNGEVKEFWSVHCNWGWNGIGDGWYANYNLPVDQVTLQPLVPGSYYRNNAYIWFCYNEGRKINQ